jgi:hypothetical protein
VSSGTGAKKGTHAGEKEGMLRKGPRSEGGIKEDIKMAVGEKEE